MTHGTKIECSKRHKRRRNRRFIDSTIRTNERTVFYRM